MRSSPSGGIQVFVNSRIPSPRLAEKTKSCVGVNGVVTAARLCEVNVNNGGCAVVVGCCGKRHTIGGGSDPVGDPGGVRPCQPGWVMPVPGSVETDNPSAETVAVPSITSRPVV